jgi:hypothetical protein
METRNPANLDPYQKWEPMIDTSSFLGAGALTCALQGVSLIEPTGLGILLTSGASALGIATLSKFLPKDPPFLKVCAAVAAIALTAFSLPFVFTALGTHAFILLTSQTALQLFVINLITKAAAFALFQAGLFFKNYNSFRLPKTVGDIDKLKSSELLEVKNHLLQFPAKTKELPLPYQVSLNKNLKAIGQEQLPLACYSQVGEEWSKEDVKHLHKEDLSQLSLNQRIEIAELFLNYELAPQKRPYAKEEFPKFDTVLEKKKFSQAAADWVSLLLQLDPKATISPKILKELKIEQPAQNDVIVLPPVEKEKGYDYYSIFDWRLGVAAATLALVKTAHYVANNSFTAANSVLPEKLPGTALIDLGKTVYEPFTPPDLALKQIAKLPSTALIGLGRTIYGQFTIPHSLRLEKLIPAVARPIVSQNIGTPVVTEIASSSSTYLYAAGLLGLGAVTAYVAYRNWGTSEEQNRMPPLQPIVLNAPPPSSNVLVTADQNIDRNRYVGLNFKKGPPVLVDLEHQDIPHLYSQLREQHPHLRLPEDMWRLAGQTINVSGPVPQQLQELISSAEQPNLLENASEEAPVMEMIELIDEPKKVNWEAFKQYVGDHCSGIEEKAAVRYACQGLDLIKRLKQGSIDRSASEEDVIAICWGKVAHSITKGDLFVEGMIDFKDENHAIFNFLYSTPSCYGRASTHYKTRAIRIENGTWKGYKHIGIDLEPLPSGMRTVVFGKIATTDEFDHTYLKMETSGTNLHVFSDLNAIRNIAQPLGHLGGLLVSQAKRNFPGVFGEVGGGEHDRKEHLPPNDRKTILELLEQIKEQDQSIQIPSKAVIDEWGFSKALDIFEAALQSSIIQSQLKAKIEQYMHEINLRYPNSSHRKGNEIRMDDSVTGYEELNNAESLQNSFVIMEQSTETTKNSDDEVIDEFADMECDAEAAPNVKKIAITNLLSNDELKSGTVNTYADFLNARQPQFNFVNHFIYPELIANAQDKDALIQEKLALALGEG